MDEKERTLKSSSYPPFLTLDGERWLFELMLASFARKVKRDA